MVLIVYSNIGFTRSMNKFEVLFFENFIKPKSLNKEGGERWRHNFENKAHPVA